MDLNSAGFGHMFPYSNIHELNIDWLLATVKEMEAKVVSLEERIAEAEQRIEDHEQRIQLIETEIATLRQEWEAFKQYVENRFDELEQNIRDLFVELETKIDAKFAQLEHDINDKFTALESELRLEIQNVLRYIIDTCAEFTAKVTALEGRVAQLESDMQDCCITISGKLDDVLNALDELNPELREKVITQNGVYLAADEGATGFWKVTVNVDTGTSVLVPLEVTANGTYNPETGTDGFSSVVVNVPQAGFRTQEKTTTENGEVTPDAGYDGLSKVTVDVPQRTAEALTITQNGTTQTPAGKYYDPITVDVPNVPERTAEALTITQNGTTQTPAGKYYDPITVDVPQFMTTVSDNIKFADYSTTAPISVDVDETYMLPVAGKKLINPFLVISGALEINVINLNNGTVNRVLNFQLNSLTITYNDNTTENVISTTQRYQIAAGSITSSGLSPNLAYPFDGVIAIPFSNSNSKNIFENVKSIRVVGRLSFSTGSSSDTGTLSGSYVYFASNARITGIEA